MDKIKDYLPLASAFFLIVGALRLIFFYGFFGVDIISFIELSEIFSLSLSFLVNSSIISFVFLLFVLPGITDGIIEKESDKKSAAVNALLLFAFMVFWMFNAYDIWGDYVIAFRVNYDYFIFFIFIISVQLVNKYFLPILKERVLKVFSVNFNENTFFIVTAIISIFSLCVLQARSTARDILLKRKTDYVEMKLDSTVIKSDSSYRFIGKTKNYVFFYNLKNNIADVYSMEGSKKMSFQNDLPALQMLGKKDVPEKK